MTSACVLFGRFPTWVVYMRGKCRLGEDQPCRPVFFVDATEISNDRELVVL